MKLKKRQLIDLFDAMKQISETEKNNKMFTYTLTLNEENLKPKVIAILSCAKPSDEFVKYENEREALIAKYAERDDNGNYVVNASTNLIKISNESVESATKEFNELNSKNVGIINKRTQELDEYNKLLDTDVDVDVEQTSIEYFPEKINKIMMKALKHLIKS